METGVDVSVLWADNDVVELRFSASNGRFSGVADLYVDHDALPRLAKTLRGFPALASDRRVYEFGTFETSFAGGGVRMVFRCLDTSGHAVVEILIRTDPGQLDGREETASLAINVEAAAIDKFVDEVGRMELRGGSSSHLAAAI